MQLQMEVWNIEECDFLETVFKQYNSEEEFYNDRGKSGYVFTRNEKNQRKGIIIQFYNGSEPVYKYPPVDCSKETFEKWYDKILTFIEEGNREYIGFMILTLHLLMNI